MKNIADDVWFEIFLHLSFTSIFKFKCVSKVWFSILSSPNFIQKWYKLNSSSLLPWAMVGYAPDSSEEDDRKLKRYFTIAYPDLHSPFINHHQNGFSFKFLIPNFPNGSNNDEKLKNIYLRSSSNGLILCSISSSSPSQRTLYVCNPLTQKSVVLPPVIRDIPVTGLICSNESCSSSTSYKVIIVPRFKATVKEFKVLVFCSDLGEWDMYDVLRLPDVTWEFSILDNFITCNGVFYWFQKGSNKVLAFSVNRNTNHGTWGGGIECRSINMPDQTMHMGRCLGESEGLICYASIVVEYTKRSLSIWVLGEDWHLLHTDNKFNDMLAQFEIGGATTVDLIAEIRILGFNPYDKNVVIFGYKNHVWAYNIRTSAYEQLCHTSFPGSSLPSVADMFFFPFAFKPRPTILPPFSCRDTLTFDGNIQEIEN